MNKTEWIKIAKGAGIAIGGAALTYAAEIVIPAMQQSGSLVLLATSASLAIAINIGRKKFEAWKASAHSKQLP